MRGTARLHSFLHIDAHLVTKAALGRMGQIHPISTCTEGKSANISKYGFSLLDYPSWIRCRWPPQYRWVPPEHPRDTSHTFSAIGAAGSQSALYLRDNMFNYRFSRENVQLSSSAYQCAMLRCLTPKSCSVCPCFRQNLGAFGTRRLQPQKKIEKKSTCGVPSTQMFI